MFYKTIFYIYTKIYNVSALFSFDRRYFLKGEKNPQTNIVYNNRRNIVGLSKIKR